jgi:hypothetical protein
VDDHESRMARRCPTTSRMIDLIEFRSRHGPLRSLGLSSSSTRATPA